MIIILIKERWMCSNMFVCNCNGITEDEVDEAIRSGVVEWPDVHAYHGYEPCCGRCEDYIRDAMANNRAAVQGQACANVRPGLAAAS